MKDLLFKLVVHLRAMQLSSHFFHHVSAKALFFQDHEAFSGFYQELDGDYDGVSERFIGLFGSEGFNLQMIIAKIQEKIKIIPSQPKENYEMFAAQLSMENELNALVKAICSSPEASEGTKQLVGNIADKSEVRIYKIKRRMVK